MNVAVAPWCNWAAKAMKLPLRCACTAPGLHSLIWLNLSGRSPSRVVNFTPTEKARSCAVTAHSDPLQRTQYPFITKDIQARSANPGRWSETYPSNGEHIMSFSFSKRSLVLGILGACSLLQASVSHADTYPSRPLTLVVGYPAGGSVDLTARLLAEELSSHLGQSVVVENAGGAGGTIGAQRVQRAAADGYTLLLGSTNEMIIAGMINKAVRYDGQKDFTPVGMIASQPLLLAASKESGIRSAADYAQKLRAAEPEAFSFGSSGVGTTLHLAGEMVNASTGTTAMHVPYRGVPPLVSDLMS